MLQWLVASFGKPMVINLHVDSLRLVSVDLIGVKFLEFFVTHVRKV